LSIDYFYSLTPRQFYNTQKGYRLRQEADFKDNWERTRSLMFAVLQPHLKKRSATEKDIMIFPWEKNTNQQVIDLEQEMRQVEENKKKWEARDALKNKKTG
jgi:hypothetical protein